MTTVLLDKELREKLKDLEHEIILTDESGQKIGRYVPEAEYMKMLYERAKLKLSDEELEKARREAGGRSTAEVLERLSQS